MSNERFRCLICSTSSPRLGSGLSPDKVKEERKNLYKSVLVLHKLLQIPMWECTQYLLSPDGGNRNDQDQNIINSIKLCPHCAEIVDHGRCILERVEGLQAQLQTLQATLQNQILSQNLNQEEDNEGEEDATQKKLRDSIQTEIRKNVNRSSLQSSRDGSGNSRTPASSTPVLAEENPATEGEQEQEHLRMEFEVGEMKTEQELGEDPLAFGYEVIDLANDDNDEATSDMHGQDLDAMVAEVTKGGVIYDVDKSQLEIQPPWSTQSAPSFGRDGSPLPIPPQRKRIRSMAQENPSASTIPPGSGSNSPVQIIAQISQSHQQGQGQQSPQPQPGPSRQYLQPQRTQSLPLRTQTQSPNTNLLQLLLNPPTVPSPPSFPSYGWNNDQRNSEGATALQMQPLIHGKQVVWSGILEWHERRKEGVATRNAHQMYCQIFSAVVNHIPTVNTAGWPDKLIMQCVPKFVLSAVGPTILQDTKTLLFEFDQPLSRDVEVVTNIFNAGYAGCIHFAGSSPPCTTKLMALVYIKARRQFVGIIPEQQEIFVSTFRTAIQNYTQRQLQVATARQLQQHPSQNQNQNQPNIVGGSNHNLSQLQVTSVQRQLLPLQRLQTGQPFQQQQIQNQTHQGQALSTVHHLPTPMSNSALVNQRQLNLLKIQQLQQNLEQAQRSEMNFQVMQQGSNTITSFSMQQSGQQHNNFGSFNLNPGQNNG